MNKQQRQASKEINHFLQAQYMREQQVRKTNPELADTMQRITSLMAEQMLMESGLRESYKQFWAERKGKSYDRT
jgi:hypothetical protein